MLDSLTRKALFALDPEFAHTMAVTALKTGLVPGCRPKPHAALAVRLWDLDFPNPLGVAAGFDKNAEVPDALLRLGFGAAEVGTITPLAQPGNPKPRMFRLVDDEAVINRLGFNNKGHLAAQQSLAARKGRPGIIGINVGANKDSDDRTEDYVTGVKAFADYASYFTVNISSPNTPGLRDLQARDALDNLLGRVLDERNRQTERVGRTVPLLLKIAPDLDELGLDDVCAVALERGIDGMIVSNTTLDRPSHLHCQDQLKETGGLSGAPLFAKSTIALAKVRERVGPDLPLVGVGGVRDAGTALEKIRAGAHLVQLYTGWIYGGALMIPSMLKEMAAELQRSGATSLDDIRGETTRDWAVQPLSSKK